jgi:peptide/nickel transport system substrate-binding protein
LRIARLTAVAAVAIGALALAGCSAGGSEIQEGTAITVVQNSGVDSLNPNTSAGNSTYNQNPFYLASAGFNYYDSTPKLIKNEKFGKYEVLSQSPLTVKYTIADGVKWSDGAPVDAADLLLTWVSSQSKYNSEKGVNFTSALAGAGLDLVVDVPKISDDHKSLTLVYSKPYVDWELNLSVGVPAHVVYEEAFPEVTDAAKAKDALIKAVQGDDTAALTKIATAWSTAFNVTDTPTDAKLLVGDGAYVVSKIVKDSYITLTANKNYTWGPLPKVQQVTIRIIQDPTAQVQALENGEVSIISGQATADTVTKLKGIKDVTTTTTATGTYEHIDLTFNNKGPFDPATYGGDAKKALLVRQAFLKVIPRQDIVDKLIKPVSDTAKLANSQTFLPGAAGYDESVAQNGSDAYAKVDVAAAKSLLAEAGVTTPVDVKFMYGKSNTRRASEFALVQASAKEAGFNVIDAGDDKWSSKLGDGTYDAVLFAWQFTSLAVTSTQPQLQTGGGVNFNGYSNPDVDTAYTTLAGEFDAAKQRTLLAQVDKQLWADAYGVTIFQFPNVSAWSNNVANVQDAPLAPNVFWNYWDWSVKKGS